MLSRNGTPQVIGSSMDDAQINLHLGRRLRRRRRALRLTQDQLGAACGVTYQTIQKYECAATRIHFIGGKMVQNHRPR